MAERGGWGSKRASTTWKTHCKVQEENIAQVLLMICLVYSAEVPALAKLDRLTVQSSW